MNKTKLMIAWLTWAGRRVGGWVAFALLVLALGPASVALAQQARPPGPRVIPDLSTLPTSQAQAVPVPSTRRPVPTGAQRGKMCEAEMLEEGYRGVQKEYFLGRCMHRFDHRH